jgi:hypothetical protein
MITGNERYQIELDAGAWVCDTCGAECTAADARCWWCGGPFDRIPTRGPGSLSTALSLPSSWRGKRTPPDLGDESDDLPW